MESMKTVVLKLLSYFFIITLRHTHGKEAETAVSPRCDTSGVMFSPVLRAHLFEVLGASSLGCTANWNFLYLSHTSIKMLLEGFSCLQRKVKHTFFKYSFSSQRNLAAQLTFFFPRGEVGGGEEPVLLQYKKQ